jgi:hypothetical protein
LTVVSKSNILLKAHLKNVYQRQQEVDKKYENFFHALVVSSHGSKMKKKLNKVGKIKTINTFSRRTLHVIKEKFVVCNSKKKKITYNA